MVTKKQIDRSRQELAEYEQKKAFDKDEMRKMRKLYSETELESQ